MKESIKAQEDEVWKGFKDPDALKTLWGANSAAFRANYQAEQDKSKPQ